MRQGASTAARTRMIGVIVASVVVVCLMLTGVIICLRRRMSRKSPRRAVGETRTMLNVSPPSTSSHMMGQQESGMTAQGQNPFLDHRGALKCDSDLTVAAVQRSRSQLGRYSQISTSSSNPRSIRFTLMGSHRSSTISYYSQATVSVLLTDVARTLSVDPPADPESPRSPISVNTTIDHSASWRGTNLSNIINTARGVNV